MGEHLRLFRLAQALKERQLFSYLPDLRLLQEAGYLEVAIGRYMQQVAGQALYRITVLSQSSLFLLYRDEHLVTATGVESHEDLIRLLITSAFPFH